MAKKKGMNALLLEHGLRRAHEYFSLIVSNVKDGKGASAVSLFLNLSKEGKRDFLLFLWDNRDAGKEYNSTAHLVINIL